MTLLVRDPDLEARIKAERQAAGADRYDEVWDGVYVLAAMPNNEHQEIVTRLCAVLATVIDFPGRGKVMAGVNVSDREEDWQSNYRVPDVAVFLEGGRALDRETFWHGGPDFAVEVLSRNDPSRDKIPFYGALGVRELLIVDRQPWRLELYRHDGRALREVGRTEDDETVLSSAVVPMEFRLTPGPSRPTIAVTHRDGARSWAV